MANLPYVSRHAMNRLRERHPPAAGWSPQYAASVLARWIESGAELGGQYRGSRCCIPADQPDIAIVYRDATPRFRVIITVLTSGQAHVNSQQIGGPDTGVFAGQSGSRVTERHSRRGRLSRQRLDKKRSSALAECDDDSDYPPDETRRNNRRRRKPAHHSRRRGTSAGESGEGFD